MNAITNARRAKVAGLLGATCCLAVLGVTVAGPAGAASNAKPDAKIIAKGKGGNLRFVEQKTEIEDGGLLKIKNESSAEHTLSLVKTTLVPKNGQEMRRCYERHQVCDKITRAHEVNFMNNTIGRKIVDSDGEGFDSRFTRHKQGDSVFFNKRNYENDVQGSTTDSYAFICVIHPWMNGKIDVD